MLWFDLQRKAGATLTRQLYDQLVERILSGELAAGTRLPSSRLLAGQLAIARNLVLDVYEQLIAEGYLEARPGSGTSVAILASRPGRPAGPPASPAAGLHPVPARDVIAFATGIPDLARFPRARWLAAVRRAGFFGPDAQWGYSDPAGDPALRTEIAAYLRRVKGFVCAPEQVLVTNGTAQGLLLVALSLRDHAPGALVEDPTIGFVPSVLRRCGYRLRPVPVDAQGLDVTALPRRPRAALVVVSPSHQFPLGGTLPVQRRLALLDYARRQDLFIFEDDYDGEFRFAGAPTSSIFRLDPQRVIHSGTFSKCLSPALRLGYVVVPEPVLPRFREIFASLHASASAATQAALAGFLRDGHLERHVVRMRRRYQRKMRVLEQTLAAEFGSDVAISGNTTGLHLVATFRGRAPRRLTQSRLTAAGVEADLVDDFTAGKPRHPGALVLGYGDLEFEQIREGVRRLGRALSS